MQEINNTVSIIGGYASILALLITLISIIIYQIKKLNERKISQKEELDKLNSEIYELAKSGTTAIKRQDIFSYISEKLAALRHFETRSRFRATTLYIMVLMIVITNIETIKALTLFKKGTMITLIVFLVYCMYKLNQIHEEMYDEIKSYSQGYLKAISEHLKLS